MAKGNHAENGIWALLVIEANKRATIGNTPTSSNTNNDKNQTKKISPTRFLIIVATEPVTLSKDL